MSEKLVSLLNDVIKPAIGKAVRALDNEGDTNRDLCAELVCANGRIDAAIADAKATVPSDEREDDKEADAC